MNSKNILFVILLLVQIIHIKSQDEEAAAAGGVESGESAEGAGIIDDKDLWPDLSCHPKYTRKATQDNEKYGRKRSRSRSAGENLQKLNEYCNSTTSSNSHDRSFAEQYRVTCPKHCVLARLGLLKSTGIFTKRIMLCKTALALRNDVVGPELGKELAENVYENCLELYKEVFKRDRSKNPCGNERVNEVYDCINKALKCWSP